MKQTIKLLLEKSPKHYPPQTIQEVDMKYDIAHPWKRYYRQNGQIVRISACICAFIWLLAFLDGSLEFFIFSSIVTIIFIFLSLEEKFEDEKNGHLSPNSTGDYWRLRMAYIESIKNKSFNECSED